MKKIYNNTTKHAIFVTEKVRLLPGTNVVDEIDDKKNAMFAKMKEEGLVEIIEDTARAVKLANTQSTVDDIVALAKDDEKTKKAGKNRKNELDEIDDEAKKAADEANKKKDEEEEDK